MRELAGAVGSGNGSEMLTLLGAAGRPLAQGHYPAETITMCQRPPFRLRLLPPSWPGALSPM